MHTKINRKIPFEYILAAIFGVVTSRYFVMKFAFQLSDMDNFYNQTVFKSISCHAITSIFGVIFVTFYHYRFSNSVNLIYLIAFLSVIVVQIFHFFIYRKIIEEKPNYLIYLILYLCGIKIVPWLWLYKLFY